MALTEGGIAAFEAMAKGHEAKLDTLLGGLTAEDLDQLRGILMRALPDTDR